jgi:hypothetical protein
VYQIQVILKQRKVDIASLTWLDWILFSGVPMLGNASLIAGAAGLIAEKPFASYAIAGGNHAPAACRHIGRMVPHVEVRDEPGCPTTRERRQGSQASSFPELNPVKACDQRFTAGGSPPPGSSWATMNAIPLNASASKTLVHSLPLSPWGSAKARGM